MESNTLSVPFSQSKNTLEDIANITRKAMEKGKNIFRLIRQENPDESDMELTEQDTPPNEENSDFE